MKKMKRLAGKRRWDEADGRLAVDAWRESGLSIEAFAREHGFGGWRLRWWASKVEKVSLAKPTSTTKSELADEQRLVPAVVRFDAHSQADGPAIILRLPDGMEVELRDVVRVEPEEIGRLIAEVRRAR